MPDTAPVVPSLIDRLIRAQIAGCECMTKTPDPKYHDGLCRYRLCYEAWVEIGQAQQNERAMQRRLTEVLYNSAAMKAALAAVGPIVSDVPGPTLQATYVHKEDGTLVAITLTDDEHRLHRVLWEAK